MTTLRMMYHVVIPLSAVFLCLGGVGLAYADGGWTAALVGGTLSLLVTGAAALIARSLFAFPEAEKAKSQEAEKVPLGWTAEILLRLICLIPFIVGTHEAYWLTQLAVLAGNHVTTSEMTQATFHGMRRDVLRKDLGELRPFHQAVKSRPTCWLIRKDVAQLNDANLLFMRVIDGKVEPHAGDGNGTMIDRFGDVVAAEAWRSENPIAKRLTDRIINAYGHGMSKKLEHEMEVCWNRGWILRWIPIDAVLPVEATQEVSGGSRPPARLVYR